MPFDAKQFLKTKFSARSEDVPVPDLAAFFPPDAEPLWRVRGLTGQELGRAAEAAEKNKNLAALLEGLTADSSKERSEAVKEMFGLGADTPADVAKRIEHLTAASVDPLCPLDLAVKLCETYPIEFYRLTNKIVELTGLGQLPGKPPPSGEIKKSEPASRSATQEGASSSK